MDETALTTPISRIKPDPEQPRKQFDETSLTDLETSLIKHGVLQPLIVRPEGDLYYIVAGERRYRAALRAGLSALPCRTVTTGEEVLEIQLVENLQREDHLAQWVSVEGGVWLRLDGHDVSELLSLYVKPSVHTAVTVLASCLGWTMFWEDDVTKESDLPF